MGLLLKGLNTFHYDGRAPCLYGTRWHKSTYSSSSVHYQRLQTLTNFNRFLQIEEPLIHCLHNELQKFMNKLVTKLIKSELTCSEQMYNVESFGRYFSFCSHFILRNYSCLISFHLFDGMRWKLKDGFFSEPLTQPVATELGIMKITMNEVIK